MKDALTIYKTFLIGYVVLCVFIVGCEVKEQKEPLPKERVDPQRPVTQESADEQESVVKPVPPGDTERTDTLSEAEKAEAEKVKKWLKENGYTVTLYSVSHKNGSTAMALGLGSSATVDNVTLVNLGNNKVRLTLRNVGAATFTIDANGELQPTK